MPDDLFSQILRPRAWVTGMLTLILLLTQITWVYAPAAAGSRFAAHPSESLDAPAGQPLSALPAWFNLAHRPSTLDSTFAQLAVRPGLPPASRPLGFQATVERGTRLLPLAQLSTPSLQKSASVVTATVDQVFTYTLVFTVPSGNALTNVRIEDSWGSDPDVRLNGVHGNYSGPTPLSGGTPPLGASVSSGTRDITWVLPDIVNDSGQPYVYGITYQVKVFGVSFFYDWVDEQTTNGAVFSWDGGSVDDQVTVDVVLPDLQTRQIVVSPDETAANPAPPDNVVEGLRAGDVITVYQFITNTVAGHPAGSVSPAYDLRLRYRLPDWLAFDHMVSGHADPVTSTGGFGLNAYTQLEWSAVNLGGSEPELNRLNPGESLTVIFVGRVRTNVAAGRRNDGQMEPRWYYYPGGSERMDLAKNRTVSLRSAAPTILKTEFDPLGDGEVKIFDPITYTVAVTLPGSGVTFYTPTIELRDVLFDGLSYVAALHTPTGWSVPVTAPDGNNTRITWFWEGGAIDGSGTYTFSFLARDDGYYNDGSAVPPGPPGFPEPGLRNEARFRWGTHDGQTLEAVDDVRVVHVRPQIEPNKSANPSSITQSGQQIVWTINNVRNQSAYGATAWNIVLTDTLPPGFGFVGAYPPGYSTTTIGSSVVVTWGEYISLTEGSYLPAPSPDNFYRITTTAPAVLPVGQYYENHVTVRYSDRPEGELNRQTYAFTRTVNLAVNGNLLQRDKLAAPSGDLRIGDTVFYTAAVALAPGAVAYWPRFYDELPLGLHYVSPTLKMQGASLLTLTLGTHPWQPRQTVEWYATTLSNPTASTVYFTATFEARVTATDTNDGLLYTGNSDMRGRVAVDNRYQMSWNWTDRRGGPYDTSAQFSNNTNNDVVQPFLVDRAPFKTLVSPAAGATVQSGDRITYALSVYNTGLAPAYDVVVSDTLPAGVTFDAYQARLYPYGGGSAPATALAAPTSGDRGTVGWLFEEIPAGDGTSGDPDSRLVVTYTLLVQDDVGAGATLANSAWISDYSSQPGAHLYERHYADLAGVGDQAPAVVAPTPQISKTASVSEVLLGGLVVYTVTLPEPALGATMYDVAVTDTLPGPVPGPMLVLDADWSGPAPTLFDVTGDTVAARYVSITAGARVTLLITAQVPLTAVGGLTSNQALVVWEDAAGGGEQHATTSNPAEVVIVAPELEVTKDAPGAAPPGHSLVYTIDFANSGTATAADVRLTDTLPISVTFLGFGASRPVTPVAGFPNPVAWELGDLAAGESGTIWLTTTVWPTAPLNGSLVNSVTIHTSTPGDNPLTSQDVITTFVAGSFLEIAKSASPDPVQAGGSLRYTLTVTNDGSLPTENLVITDRVPVSTTFDSASGGVLPVGGVLTWTPADIAGGSRAQVTFTVQVDSPLISGTQIVNDEYGASATNAPPSGPLPPVIVTVHSQPELVIAKTAVSAVDAGEKLVYTIYYQNWGNAVAHNVYITESYDANVAYSGAVPAPDVGNNVWDLGALAPTAGDYTIVVTVQVGVSVADGTWLTNTVHIDSDETEPQSAVASTRVGDYIVYMPILLKGYAPPPPPVGVNLVIQNIQVGPATPEVGQATRITVTLYNSGTNTVSDDFWVDLYVDPTTTPTVNVLWNEIAPYGKAWLVHDDIPGGGTLVIHTDQPDDSQDPGAIYSNWPGWFVSAGTHVLYAQVDSYGLPNGLIVEDDETDNVSGPMSVTVVPSTTMIVPAPSLPWRERRGDDAPF